MNAVDIALGIWMGGLALTATVIVGIFIYRVVWYSLEAEAAQNRSVWVCEQCGFETSDESVAIDHPYQTHDMPQSFDWRTAMTEVEP